MAKDNLQKLRDAYDDERIHLQEIGDELRWMRDQLNEMYLQDHPDHNNYRKEVIALEKEFEAQRKRKNEAKRKLDQAIISDPSYYDNPRRLSDLLPAEKIAMAALGFMLVSKVMKK